MSNLLKLIADNNLESFDQIKSFLTPAPYCIEFREDKPVSNMYLLINTENSDMSMEVVRECNGIILDKNTNKLVAYGLNTLIEYNDTTDLNMEDSKFYEGYDGPLVKVYYYNAKWYISTTKCINGSKSRWVSNRSFTELFLDSGIDLDQLDKNNCYCYVLEHPENRCVKPVYSPIVHLISTRDMTTLELTRHADELDLSGHTDPIKHFKSLPYHQGVTVVETSNMSIKIFSDNYKQVKNIRGNVADIRKRYLELMKNPDDLNNLVAYYPEYQHLYLQVEQDIWLLAKNIQNVYFKKYVRKEKPEFCHKYKQTLKQLHAQYLKTKKINTIQSVHERLINVPGPSLYWMLYA
jgi:hypothetical protein